jgi:hypothetical protein
MERLPHEKDGCEARLSRPELPARMERAGARFLTPLLTAAGREDEVLWLDFALPDTFFATQRLPNAEKLF